MLHKEITLENITAILVAFLPFRLFAIILSSPQPDVPAAGLSWLVFLLSLEKIEKKKGDRFDTSFILILVYTVFAVTVKISLFPIGILPLYFFILAWRKTKSSQHLAMPFLAVTAISGVILIPWLARNVILSGYLVYPFPSLDLFHVDWKMPADIVRVEADSITSWARIPRENVETVMAIPFPDWVPTWYGWLNIKDRQLLFTILIGIPLLGAVTVGRIWSQKKRFLDIGGYFILTLTAVICMFFWFVTAPAFRYGYGYIGMLACLAIAPWLKWLVSSFPTLLKPFIILLVIVLLVYQGSIAVQIRQFTEISSVIVRPIDYPVPAYHKVKLGDLRIFITDTNAQCYYQPFPCSWSIDGIYRRGPLLTDGFRRTP